MYRKSYPNIAALFSKNVAKGVSFSNPQAPWSLFSSVNDNLFLFYRHAQEKFVTTPLYVHSFSAVTPTRIADAENFCLQHPNVSDLRTTADKLRYYRYKKSLPQREIADYAGISRSTYIHFEDPKHDYYPIDI